MDKCAYPKKEIAFQQDDEVHSKICKGMDWETTFSIGGMESTQSQRQSNRKSLVNREKPARIVRSSPNKH